MTLRSFLGFLGASFCFGEMADLSLKPTITGSWLNFKSNSEQLVAQGFFLVTEELDNSSISVQVQRILHTSGQVFIFAFLKRVKHGYDYI